MMTDVAERGAREDIGGRNGIFRFHFRARKKGRGQGFQSIEPRAKLLRHM